MFQRLLILFALVSVLTAQADQRYRVIVERQQKLVLFDDATISRVQEIANSKSTRDEKRKVLKALFFVIGASLGDGKSYCDVAVREYFPLPVEKSRLDRCLDALTSDEFMYNLTDDIAPVEEVQTVNLLLAKTAKLLMML
ncbi:MAG: hypothetical protein IT288_07140 [Bdellovibrionales bacterium]|nr:hypothetical protein [Bdellovibrionales bacterium]